MNKTIFSGQTFTSDKTSGRIHTDDIRAFAFGWNTVIITSTPTTITVIKTNFSSHSESNGRKNLHHKYSVTARTEENHLQ